MKNIIYKGKETTYYINSKGKVYNSKTKKFLQGCIYNNGYRYALLTLGTEKKAFAIHRLVAEYYLPNPNNLEIVNHKDGDKTNNNKDNLEWVSQSENVQHSYNNDLTSRATGKRNKILIPVENNAEWRQYRDTNYFINRQGEVYNNKTHILLKQTMNTAGYIRHSLRIDGKSVSKLAHVLVMETWGNHICSAQEVINHKDGNTTNNCLDNLEVVSKADNMKHACYVLNKNVRAIAAYEGDNIVYQFPSIVRASDYFNVTPGAIQYALKHDSKSCGYYWKYTE